jgi:hypothetical protein
MPLAAGALELFHIRKTARSLAQPPAPQFDQLFQGPAARYQDFDVR